MRRALFASLFLFGCATYRQDLNRGESFYDQSDYEKALATFRLLESDMDSLSLTEQARYAYLRGMTDFRLGYRADARHWLALAKAIDQEHPGGLSAQFKSRAEESLNELNREVYGKGFEQTLAKAPESGPLPAPAQNLSLPAGTCTSASDCSAGHACQNNICVKM
ncbi:MAG: hypothetical protein SFV15_21455 [Polyangiaceae bacterium]|nr:hypothetical protein [Polyangiaceae bacterium]